MVRLWGDCLMWSPSWKRRWCLMCVTYVSVNVHASLMSHLVLALDPEFNMYSVRGSQASGLMVEEWSRGWTWWSGKWFCYCVTWLGWKSILKQSLKHAHNWEREIKLQVALQTSLVPVKLYCWLLELFNLFGNPPPPSYFTTNHLIHQTQWHYYVSIKMLLLVS